MSIEQLIFLGLGLTIVALLGGLVAWVTGSATRREDALELARRELPRPPFLPAMRLEDGHPRPRRAAGTAPPGYGWQAVSAWVAPADGRQVARIVAFLFLASVAILVALTSAWSEAEGAIFTLLAVGSLLVVVFTDLLPPTTLGALRRPLEGICAVLFVALLVALTGGPGSPFVVGLYLVVAAAALSSEGRAALSLAALSVASLALITLASAIRGVEPTELAWSAVAAVTLVLLAALATAAGRAHREARELALRASRFDALTGLFNRGFFFDALEQEIRRSERMRRPFTMLMLDLDDLKPVNDTFGHQWGDRLLTAVADVLRRTLRFTDCAARYGGDEFLVLLPETDASGGFIVAETIRREIAELALAAEDRKVRSSVSIGLVTYPEDGTSMEQLVAAADVAMYESKRRGKNQIVGYRMRTERVPTAIEVAMPEAVTERAGGRASDAPARDTQGPAPGEGRSEREPLGDGRALRPPDAPWLTRTDGQPAARGGAPAPAEPATHTSGPRRSVGHGRRGHEARGHDRHPEQTWVALPIEPSEPETTHDPGEASAGQGIDSRPEGR